ncbi:hypothetical protein [Chryseobacterium sp.]|uniref:hypothetical protein n=1 Tax=Chryseobacterium sp. TaxID=1871047 RepID=UPI0011CCD689|nr:hypothetical protein [Chryseobacterium sp.]TXF75037.1 hypothetical protein FUA25_12230 [Chryseobacterium sp.]
MSQEEQYFSELAEQIPNARPGKMFGALCIKMPNGKAGAMFWRDLLVVKISGETLEEALKLSGVSVFTPAEGRPMGGWYVIPFEHQQEWKKLMEISCAAAEKLEKNEKKPKK